MTDRRARWLSGKRLGTKPGFWFVWAPDALRPSKQYRSLSAAQADAEALRAKYPEKEFLVYRAGLEQKPGRAPAQVPPEPPRPGDGRGCPRLTLRREKTP